jgi:hypothetical protein
MQGYCCAVAGVQAGPGAGPTTEILVIYTSPQIPVSMATCNDEYSSVTLKVSDVPISALRVDHEDTLWFASLSAEQVLAYTRARKLKFRARRVCDLRRRS